LDAASIALFAVTIAGSAIAWTLKHRGEASSHAR
jgi:hypothetical protein